MLASSIITIIINIPLQIGTRPFHRSDLVQMIILGPSMSYPGLHINRTLLRTSKLLPIRRPSFGLPGSGHVRSTKGINWSFLKNETLSVRQFGIIWWFEKMNDPLLQNCLSHILRLVFHCTLMIVTIKPSNFHFILQQNL